ncbi:hypothetical protein ABID47_003795 [Paenibacillus favisporus]|uniref:Uncharacterized protein n=1 Tax=Paenibacillus favisporus TaxID=221028 RepID=A0ABV2F623_9BACL
MRIMPRNIPLPSPLLIKPAFIPSSGLWNGFNGAGGIVLEKRSGPLYSRISTFYPFHGNPGITGIGSMIRMRSDD